MLQAYCEAFFYGCNISVVRPGGKITDKSNPRKITKKKIPDDFLEEHKISYKGEDETLQFEAKEIITALSPYKNRSTFAVLGMTNLDLYKEDWDFVAGLANQETCTGVFSFYRMDPDFDDGTDWKCKGNEKLVWLKRSCRVMVHELAHMFGLKHCIYYNCLMNGSNGPFEGVRAPDQTLCPVCLAKLQMNMKFDCKARYESLIKVSMELGFTE